MSNIEPAGEKIVRNLQQAVERLQEDIARVELWAGALSSFTQPIPDYGHGQTKFDLPEAKPRPGSGGMSFEMSGIRGGSNSPRADNDSDKSERSKPAQKSAS